MADSTQGVPNPSPATYKVDGKEYTEAELQEAIRGTMRQDDYTRKTQAVADDRREFEEWMETQKAEIEEMRQQQSVRPSDTEDEWTNRFNRLEEKITGIDQRITTRQAREEASQAEEARVQGQMEGINAELARLSNQPGFERDEVLRTMQSYGWNDPKDVDAAYRIVSGPKIARVMAERDLSARGATAPPVMGSNGLSMPAAPFASVGEAAPSFDASKMSWQDMRRMALEDPARPR